MYAPLDTGAAEYKPSFLHLTKAAPAAKLKATPLAADAPSVPHITAPAAGPHKSTPQSMKPTMSVTRTGVNTTSPMPVSFTGAAYSPTFLSGLAGAAMPSGYVATAPPLQQYGSFMPHSTTKTSLLPPSPAITSAERSPAVVMRSVPTRMSPAIVPRHHMNPNALEFVPGRRNLADGGLEALPTSTADMELARAPATKAPPAACGLPKSAARYPSLRNSPVLHPARSNTKSATDTEGGSRCSALDVNAAAYVPQRTLTRVVLTHPSPLALVPSEDPTKDNIGMMLDDLWCLFYLPTSFGENIKEEDYNPTLVFRIDSIPTFWKVMNNVPSPSEMTLSTLFLFRDGIDPKWEDPANRDGGIVKVKIESAHIDEAWELLLCRTIGDSWSPTVRETVNGVVLKIRGRANWLEIWVTKNSAELQKDLADLWHPVLGASFATNYFTHAVQQERSHAAAAMAAEKEKKNRRRY